MLIATCSNHLETLDERTTIPVPGICALTELCLRSTYFMFEDTFFDHAEGATMGSPLSPIVANLFMEAFEEKALESAVLRPRRWVRYVDNTFVLWPHEEDELETFHRHLNSQHPSIQFTMEKKSEGKISFLDVQITTKEGKLSTGVFRKNTHT